MRYPFGWRIIMSVNLWLPPGQKEVSAINTRRHNTNTQMAIVFIPVSTIISTTAVFEKRISKITRFVP